MEDNITRPKTEISEDYSGYDPHDMDYEDQEDDEECNCSDPGCPCSGIKFGRL